MRLSLKVEGSWNLERGTWNAAPLHRPPQQARIGLGDLARPPLRTGDDVLGPALGQTGPTLKSQHFISEGQERIPESLQSGSDQKPGVIGQRPLVATTASATVRKHSVCFSICL